MTGILEVGYTATAGVACLLGFATLTNSGVMPSLELIQRAKASEEDKQMKLVAVTHLSPTGTNTTHVTLLSFEGDKDNFVGLVQHQGEQTLEVTDGEVLSRKEWKKKLTPAGAYWLYQDGRVRE